MSVDVGQWEEKARGLEWLKTPSGLVYPRNASKKVVNGSHSTFETMKRCDLRAWFDKVACVPRTPKAAPDRGVRIHALCEHFGKFGEFPGDDFTVELKDARGEKIQVKPTKLDRLCAEAAEPFIPLIEGVTHEEGIFLNPNAKTEGVFTDDEGATLGFSGKIDVFDPRGLLFDSGYFKDFDGVGDLADLPAGTPSTPDYKTRGSFNYAPGPDQLAYDVQQARYAVAGLLASPRSPYYQTEDVPERVIVAHVNIGTKTIKTWPVAAVMTRDTIEKVWGQTKKDAVNLLAMCRIDKVADVPYNRAACGDFRGCDHATICPRSPQNSNPRGRLGTLFGPTNHTGTTGKGTDSMKKINFKSLRASAPAATPTPAAPTVKSPVSFKRFAKSRTQTPDAGVVRENAKSGELGEPITTSTLTGQAIRIATASAKGVGAPVSEFFLRAACGEVGCDYDTCVTSGAFDNFLVAAPVVAAPVVAAPVVAAPVAEKAVAEKADPDEADAIQAANDAAVAYLQREGGSSFLGKVRPVAREAYNDATAGTPIGRWTHVADARYFDADIFSWSGKGSLDPISLAAGQVEAVEAAGQVEAVQEVQEVQDAPSKFDMVVRQVLAQQKAIEVSVEGGTVVVSPRGAIEAPAEKGFVPTVYVDCAPVGEDFVDFNVWLAPYCKMVETSQNVHYWRSMSYNAGPGEVAGCVARHLSGPEGMGALPAAMRVSSRHPAWVDVYSVLRSLFSTVRFVEGRTA